MRRTVIVIGLVTLLVGALVWWLPFATRTREVPATIAQPNPISAVAIVNLPAGGQACFGPFTMTSDSEQARFQVGTYFRRTGQPLTLTLTGPGYRVRRDLPGSYGDNAEMR